MKFNPAEVAVAWYGNGQFKARGAGGKDLYSIRMSEREATDAMDALEATGLFVGAGTHRMVVNPQIAGHIFYNSDQLNLEDNQRNLVVTWPMEAREAQKVLTALEKDSPVWLTVSGKMAVISPYTLSTVKLRGEEIQYTDTSGKICETSTPISREIAAPIVAQATLAIDACKSVKPVTPPDPKAVAAAAPTAKPTAEERAKLKDLFNTLKAGVFGQDEPLDALARAVRRARAGLQEENKPMGSFLFLGPTGVGKTEAARQLAKAMGYDFKKFDMSEYVSKWDASRLVGGSPNYVGYEDGGQLTNFVREHPKCVLLFDEIEKAHPEVSNLLLQVLDDAQLTDGKGKTVVFKDTVIILTSNLGTSYAKKSNMSFDGSVSSAPKPAAADEARTSREVKSFFLAEFVNRLTDVIRFTPLTPDIMLKMVDKFVEELATRMKKQDAELIVTPEARQFLADEGFSEAFGARPLKRVLEKATDPMADEILYGSLENGGTVTLGVEADAEGNRKLTHQFNAAVANDNVVAPVTSTALVIIPRPPKPAPSALG